MKFIVDAQLPRSLARMLATCGHDALHTLDLPEKNRTTDDFLCRFAVSEQRVLVTKDGDFLSSFFLRGQPTKLLLVVTGNISNKDLLELFRAHLVAVVEILSSHSLAEIDHDGLTIRA